MLGIAWIGAMPCTAYEAAGIEPLVASSPLLRWIEQDRRGQAVSTLFRVVAIARAVMR